MWAVEFELVFRVVFSVFLVRKLTKLEAMTTLFSIAPDQVTFLTIKFPNSEHDYNDTTRAYR